MTLLELAVRRIRHFAGFTRVPLKPGLNTVWGGNQSGKTTLWQVIRLLLVADRKVSSIDDTRGWGHAALTFQGDDGHTYCLARHFSESSERLARHQPGEGFVPVALPPGERGPVSPQPEGEPSLWSVCLGGAAWLPSARLRRMPRALPEAGADRPPLALLGPQPGEEGPGSVDLVPVPGDSRREAAERRMEALRGIERIAREAADREAEMAACYDRRALLSARLDALTHLDRELAETERGMAALAAAAALPDDLAHEARAYEEAHAASRAEQQRVEADIGDLELDLREVRRVRPVRHPAFYGAVGLGTLGTVVQAALGWNPATYAVLGAATLLAGYLAYLTAARNQRRRALRQRIATLRARHARLGAKLTEAHGPLLDALRDTGIPSPERLLDQRERHRVLAARRERIAARIAEVLDGDPREAIEEEIGRTNAWIAELEEVLAGLRVTGGDAEAARREHASLSRSLSLERGELDPADLDISIEPHLAAEPALREALDRRRDTYCARAGDYLARFTGGEFTRLTINGTYRPTLHTDRESGDSGPPGAGMVDLIYLAQYLAMVETLDPVGRFPLVLDEPFLSLDPERRTLLYESLREAARHRQVVVFTCQQFLTSPGDHLVRLKG